jgi:hypothetical protein
MARKSFDDETLRWVREMPLSVVLDRLRDAGRLFWRRDVDFKPAKEPPFGVLDWGHLRKRKIKHAKA